MTTRRSDGSPKTTGMDSVRAMMRGLGEIMDRLGQLADKGAADFSGTGNLGDVAGGDKGFKGVYGFSVKVGRGGGGSGLGLAVVRRVVEGHGGTVQVEIGRAHV